VPALRLGVEAAGGPGSVEEQGKEGAQRESSPQKGPWVGSQL